MILERPLKASIPPEGLDSQYSGNHESHDVLTKLCIVCTAGVRQQELVLKFPVKGRVVILLGGRLSSYNEICSDVEFPLRHPAILVFRACDE